MKVRSIAKLTARHILPLMLALIMMLGCFPKAEAAASPNATVSLKATLAYNVTGLAFNVAIQNFHIDTDYIYITQRSGSTTYLSRLKIEGKNAVYQDHMTLTNGGHGESLDGYYYNNKLYFLVGTKATEIEEADGKYWSTQIARVEYKAGANYDYTALNRFNYCNYINSSGTKIGDMLRLAVCCNQDYILFRMQTTSDSDSKSVTYSCYDFQALNALLDADKKVSMSAADVADALVFSFTQNRSSSSNYVQPNGSFQGVEITNKNVIYVNGGGFGDTPKISKMNNYGTYQLEATITNVGNLEIEGLQSLDGRLYFCIVPDVTNDKTAKKNGHKIYYINESAMKVSHTIVDQAAVPATCTTDGLTAGSYCSKCKATLMVQQVIPAFGHKYSTVYADPTCTSSGGNISTCANCGDVQIANEIPALGHSYTCVESPPNCVGDGTQTHSCSTCGSVYDYALEMPGEYHPTHDPNVLYFSFDNTAADQLRYRDNLQYGGLNYDTTEGWGGPGYATITSLGDGVLSYTNKNTSNTWGYVAVGAGGFGDAGHKNYPLKYTPGDNDWCEIRMKIDGATPVSGDTFTFKLELLSTTGNNDASTKAKNGVTFPSSQVGNGYFTLSFPLNETTDTSGNLAYSELDIVRRIHLLLSNVTKGVEYTCDIDYFYMGPEETRPSKGGDYLYFGFSNSPMAHYRYSNEIYGGRYNFDKAGTNGDDWIFTATRSPSLSVANGSLNVTVGTTGSSSTHSPWLQTATSNSAQAIMDYPTDHAEIAEVRIKGNNLVSYGGTPSVCISFVINDDAKKETSDCNVFWYPTLEELNSGEYLTLSQDITSLLETHGAERITSVRLTVFYVASPADSTGSFSVDYIYVGSEVDRPGQHCYECSNSGAVHTWSCSGCGDSYTEAHSYVDGVCVCGAKFADLLTFKSATVTLESDLSLNYYVAKVALEGFADPYVTFQKAIYDESGNVSDYEETTVNSYTEKTAADGTECYVFTFTGISAKEMSSAVSVTLSGSYEGTVYSGNAVSYSVKQYAENLLAATEDTALRTLLVDMLNYGAEAQSYFAYNTANLANAGLTEEQKAWESQEELNLMSSLSINDNEAQSIYFESAALLLEEKVTMHFYLDLDEYTGTMEDLYARVFLENAKGDLVEHTIEGTELTELNRDHVLYFDGLNAAQMRSIIGVELYSRQTASCVSPTLYYSIESYAHNKLTDSSLNPLVTAMMRYGDSVAAYAAR